MGSIIENVCYRNGFVQSHLQIAKNWCLYKMSQCVYGLTSIRKQGASSIGKYFIFSVKY